MSTGRGASTGGGGGGTNCDGIITLRGACGGSLGVVSGCSESPSDEWLSSAPKGGGGGRGGKGGGRGCDKGKKPVEGGGMAIAGIGFTWRRPLLLVAIGTSGRVGSGGGGGGFGLVGAAGGRDEERGEKLTGRVWPLGERTFAAGKLGAGVSEGVSPAYPVDSRAAKLPKE